MRFTLASRAILHSLCFLAGLASAQTPGFDAITSPAAGQNITAGSTTLITWDYDQEWPGPITISLIGGATSATLMPITNLTTDWVNSNGKFSWDVDASLGADAIYGIQIFWNADPSVFQWSNPFHIVANNSSDSACGARAASRHTRWNKAR